MAMGPFQRKTKNFLNPFSPEFSGKKTLIIMVINVKKDDEDKKMSISPLFLVNLLVN